MHEHNHSVVPRVYQSVELSELSARRAARLRIVLVTTGLLVVVLVLLSSVFGRAEPVGSYRPPLPPDALTNGCWPLPGDVRLGFGYQVRTDDLRATDDGPRRHLLLHYDEISGAEATQQVRADFAAAGVDDVVVTADDFVGTAPDAVVRGQMILDLPPSRPKGGSTCQDPFSTKQFPSPIDDRS